MRDEGIAAEPSALQTTICYRHLRQAGLGPALTTLSMTANEATKQFWRYWA